MAFGDWGGAGCAGRGCLCMVQLDDLNWTMLGIVVGNTNTWGSGVWGGMGAWGVGSLGGGLVAMGVFGIWMLH